MKSKITQLLRRLPEFGRYLIAIATILGISLLFPNHQEFNYTFEVGQQWKNQDINATFDFAILKAQEEIDRELDSLKSTLVPCYEKNATIPTQKLKTLTKRFNEKLKSVSTDETYEDVTINAQNYLNTCKTILKNIYNKGIIETNTGFGNNTPDNEILIADGKKRIRYLMSDFETIKTAEQAFTNQLLSSELRDGDFFLSIIQAKPSLIVPNVTFNEQLTNEFHQSSLTSFTTGRGMVREGERIISRGEVITEKTYQKLLSLKEAYAKKRIEDNSVLWIRIGYFVLTTLVVLLFIFFLRQHAPEVVNSYKQLSFMMMWLLVFTYLVNWLENTHLISLYLVPFCVVPIVVKNFYDDIIALFTHIAVVLLASLLSSLGFEFIFTQLLVGGIIIIANVKTRYWSKFFFSMAYLLITYLVVFIGLSMLKQGTWRLDNWATCGWFFGSVFLTLLSYPLVPLFERLFGFTSDITLDELSNLDQPLLKELSMKAPGTLQHSLQVGHLSEAAANEIGANALLVKIAALYHDIGKINNPTLFIENQQRDTNPHDNLSPFDSAKIIIGHVSEGLQLAKKYGLPKIVSEFIATHHGTTRVEYFYQKAIQDNPDMTIDANDFKYPGPNPSTREHIIMMLADSIEAASKTLKNPTEEDIERLVDKITAGKIAQNQFVNAKLTFAELEKVKTVFKRVLKSIYHNRIVYPNSTKQLPTGK
ncbi:MAG: HD family phosphohydrolase [Saprospiraceae bacterium]